LLTALAGLALACVPTSHADTLPSGPEQPASEPAPPSEPGVELAVELATEPAEPAPPPYVPREQDLVTAHQPIEFPEGLTHFLDALATVPLRFRRRSRRSFSSKSACSRPIPWRL
jgi:hypothetical protein